MPAPAYYSPQAVLRRSALLATVEAEAEGYPGWRAAVVSLGTLAREQRLAAEAPKPGRRTGRDQYEQFMTLTKSHVFDADRVELRQRFTYGTAAQRGKLIEWATAEIRTRKQAEKLATTVAA